MTALSAKRVKALLDRGMTTPEIAAQLMTSFQAVEEIARSLPVNPSPPAPPQGVLSTEGQATRRAVRSLRRQSEPRSPDPAGVETLGEREGRTAPLGDVDAIVDRAFARLQDRAKFGRISPDPYPASPARPAKARKPSPPKRTNSAQADEELGQALSAAILRKEGITRGAKEPKGCRFITGDVRSGDWRYCQERPADSSSYCRHHHGKTHYRPATGSKPGA